MEAKKRPSWEWLVFIVVLVFAVVLLGTVYSNQQKIAKQTVLHHQLQLMRTAEMLFKDLNKSNPPTLENLLTGTFRLPNEQTGRHFIDNPPKMVGGMLMDPFGNAYAYDAKTGWIKSKTPGYENW